MYMTKNLYLTITEPVTNKQHGIFNIKKMKNLMILLLAYLYVLYVILLPMVMHMHIKLLNSFGNLLITVIRGYNYANV